MGILGRLAQPLTTALRPTTYTNPKSRKTDHLRNYPETLSSQMPGGFPREKGLFVGGWLTLKELSSQEKEEQRKRPTGQPGASANPHCPPLSLSSPGPWRAKHMRPVQRNDGWTKSISHKAWKDDSHKCQQAIGTSHGFKVVRSGFRPSAVSHAQR